MYAVLVLMVSVAPAAAFLAWILRMDRREPEPLGTVLAAVGMGAGSAIPALLLELALQRLLAPGLEGIAEAAFDSFVRVAPVEELCKLAVALFIWGNRAFNEENDGIVYLGASALGFALIENVAYVAQEGIGVGVLRAFSAMPLHTVTGIVLGWHVGLARFAGEKGRARRLVARGFLLAWLLHGVYDTLVGSGSALALLALPLVVLLFVLAFAILGKGRRLSQARWGAQPASVAAGPRARGPLWMAVAARTLFGACALLWALLLVGISTAEADPELPDILMGGVLLTVLPIGLGVLLEVGYRRRTRAPGARAPIVTGQLVRGTLTARDAKTHVAHEVEVPRGAERLRVSLDFPHGEGLGHMLCLSLFDSRGFRGSGHRGGARHDVSLSAADATPGYLPGPIPPGKVRVVIHAHRIVPDEPCPYRLDVAWEGECLADVLPAGRPGPAAPAGAPGWYRGDLHAHTVHSDGHWRIQELLAAARGAGLDFVALTEHNTTSQLGASAGLEAAGPLVIAGMELTTFHGHALSLGTREWIDWGVIERERGMPGIAADVAARGGFFVIAHPHSVGDPACTGCDWRYGDMMPGTAPAVEIWNGPWDGDSNNEKALGLWYAWLNQGHRLVATAGSDAHGPGGLGGGVGFNVVGADELTEAAVLRAVARGRLYLSSGPRLELAAFSGASTAGMGETLAARSADLSVRWRGCPPGAVLRLLGEGAVLAEREVAAEGADRWDGLEARWLAVEVRDPAGSLLAVTNPVFLAP